MASFSTPKDSGAIGAFLDIVKERKSKRDEQTKEREKFVRETALAVLKTGLESGQVDPGSLYATLQSGRLPDTLPTSTTPRLSFDEAQSKYGGGNSGYGAPSFDVNPMTGRVSNMKFSPLSPTESAKAEELDLIRSSTPFPSEAGEGVVNRTTGYQGDFNPQEVAAGYPQAFAQNRLTALSAPDLFKQKRQNLVDSTKIREEFLNRPEVKEYVAINTQVRSMDALLKNAVQGNVQNKVALDQGLISMFNKLTDPNSVVRESEYARTAENLPLVNRFSGALQKLQRGGAGLTDADRQALVWGAKIIANERGRTFNDTFAGYVDLSGEYGIDQSLITRGLTRHQDYQLDMNGSFQEGQTATNPKTGQKIIFRSGRWQPLK